MYACWQQLVLELAGERSDRSETIDRLRAALTRISRRIDRQVSGGGLTSTQLSVLASVAYRGPIGLSELADIEGVTDDALAVVGKLEEPVSSNARSIRSTAGPCASSHPAGTQLRGRLLVERSALLAQRFGALPADTAAAVVAAIPALEALAAELARGPVPGRDRDPGAHHQTFSSLDNRNYRRYLGGQSTSLVGTWMQTIAQSLVVLQLTHSPRWSDSPSPCRRCRPATRPYAGVVAGPGRQRQLMIVLQSLMGVQASPSPCDPDPCGAHLGGVRPRRDLGSE